MWQSIALCFLAAIAAFAADARAVTITWSPVDNPGNANDPAGSLYGAVPYADNIGTYDVTASQYVEFLNAMGGNVFQWNEALISGRDRGLRGGSFISKSSQRLSSGRDGNNPSFEVSYWGFRVASIPESSQ